MCLSFRYNNTLELPHMPDMVFPNNVLTLKHQDGALLQFNALDALRHVSNGKINVQLACAEAWKESRYGIFSLIIPIALVILYFLLKYILTDQTAVNIWKKR